MENSDSDNIPKTTPGIRSAAKTISINLLPEKKYNLFIKWRNAKKICKYSKNVENQDTKTVIILVD